MCCTVLGHRVCRGPTDNNPMAPPLDTGSCMTYQVAHELARQARLERNSCVWIDDPPAFVRHLLVNDVTILSDQ